MRSAKVKVEIGDDSYEFDTAQELLIDRHNLDDEMTRQSAQYGWFSVLYERARSERCDLESLVESRECAAEFEIREAKKGEKLTASALKSLVCADGHRLRLLDRLRKAEHQERLLGALVSAFAQRSTMLMSLAKSRYFESSPFSSLDVGKVKENLRR